MRFGEVSIESLREKGVAVATLGNGGAAREFPIDPDEILSNREPDVIQAGASLDPPDKPMDPWHANAVHFIRGEDRFTVRGLTPHELVEFFDRIGVKVEATLAVRAESQPHDREIGEPDQRFKVDHWSERGEEQVWVWDRTTDRVVFSADREGIEELIEDGLLRGGHLEDDLLAYLGLEEEAVVYPSDVRDAVEEDEANGPASPGM